MNNAKKAYIKLMISSNESVNGKDITGLKDGSTYINNIIIKGSGEVKPDDKKKDDKKREAVLYRKRKQAYKKSRPGNRKISIFRKLAAITPLSTEVQILIQSGCINQKDTAPIICSI